MKPMLAHKYKDHGHKLPEIFHIQPKINGVRALYVDGRFQSRDEKLWAPGKLTHIAQFLNHIPSNIVLDGELYLHGTSLQQINSAVSVNSINRTPLTPSIEYWVFDFVDMHNPLMPFSERADTLITLLRAIPHTVIRCPTFRANREFAEHFYARFKQANYEGMMYRVSESPYGLSGNCTNQENRWAYLQKRKDFLDAVVPIVEIIAGKTGSKYEYAMGAAVCEFENGKLFEVGSGWSDAERFRLYHERPIGQLIRTNYEMLSDNGTPLKATFVCFEE